MILIGAIVLVGGGVRLWRSSRLYSTRPTHGVGERAADDGKGDDASNRSPRSHSHRNGRSARKKASDSTSVIDLDRATVAQIESLGVLRPGVARLIVADRDDFGPFGSMQEVERVPYLSRYDLRKLAPRVTFSLIPRPKNAVFNRRPDPPPEGRSRRRPKQGDSS